jgi:hypothetical protein
MVEMVKLGSGTFREVENFHLSRLACLIIAENADNSHWDRYLGHAG